MYPTMSVIRHFFSFRVVGRLRREVCQHRSFLAATTRTRTTHDITFLAAAQNPPVIVVVVVVVVLVIIST